MNQVDNKSREDLEELRKFEQMIYNGRDVSEISKKLLKVIEDNDLSDNVEKDLTEILNMLAVTSLGRHTLSKQYIKVFKDILPNYLEKPRISLHGECKECGNFLNQIFGGSKVCMNKDCSLNNGTDQS